jgi:hypothetical protein
MTEDLYVVYVVTGVKASLCTGGEVVYGAPWHQLYHRLGHAWDNLDMKDGSQPPFSWFGQTTGSAQPGWPIYPPPLAGGIVGS